MKRSFSLLTTAAFCRCLLLVFLIPAAYSQDVDFKLDSLEGNQHRISSIELSPDGATLAIGTESGPVIFWDFASKKIKKKVDVGAYKGGPRIAYSNDGKYLLLQQQYHNDWQMNTDIRSRVQVMDINSGVIVFSNPQVHNAALSSDGKNIVTVGKTEVTIYNISSGNKEREFKVDNLSFAIAVSNDGSLIAVSHEPTEKEIENISSIRNDKKAIKSALKFRELVSFYDFETLKKLYTSSDVLDIVFEMKFNRNSNFLYVYNVPNTRLQELKHRQGYINKIVATTGEVTREIFSTNAHSADFKENVDGTLLGVTSLETKFIPVPQVLISNIETAELLKNFNVRSRIFEGTASDRTGFAFLPDNKTVVLGYGPYLAIWNIEK